MTFIKGTGSLGAAMLIGLSAPSAQAGYVVDLTQQGSNVVASGSGAIDLTALRLLGFNLTASTLLRPSIGSIVTGPAPRRSPATDYEGGLTGPANFGNGGLISPSSGSGDIVGITGRFDGLVAPFDYVSDSPLSDTATYDNQTFMSLGVTPGTYKWTWGNGANQNFTLVIGTAVGTAVPEPSTWAMMLLGFAALGLIGYRSTGRRRPRATLS
jgi:hypothetical protein